MRQWNFSKSGNDSDRDGFLKSDESMRVKIVRG